MGRHSHLFEGLPSDVGELVRVVQHLVVYDVVASDFYGFRIPESRGNEIHIRSIERMIDRLLALDDRAIRDARTVEARITGRCRDYVLFLIAMLRARGIPARARCGFGDYFNPPRFEDHWVCEYWKAEEGRWALADPQFDETWREKLGITHDILDVPRGRFLVAGEAWVRCREGSADPSRFGISFANVHGLWFVAGNLVRDIAALNKVEMLPWDVWGGQPRPDDPIAGDRLAFLDRLAALSRAPDTSFADLRDLYRSDDRVRVPATVVNAILDRPETVE